MYFVSLTLWQYCCCDIHVNKAKLNWEMSTVIVSCVSLQHRALFRDRRVTGWILWAATFQWCNWKLGVLVVIETDYKIVKRTGTCVSLRPSVATAFTVDRLLLVTCNRSDSSVGGTKSESIATLTERGGCFGASKHDSEFMYFIW